MSTIDFAGIRVSYPLASFCESRGITLRRDGSGGRLVGQCPLHEEKSASFTVYSDGHFYCYGCGAHGDVAHLCAALDGIPIAEAARKLSGGTALVLNQALSARPETKPELYELSKAELQRMDTAAHRLATDPILISELIAERPEWNPETIRNAALEGDLGYQTDCLFQLRDGPAMLFGYSHGIKARWKNSRGERVIRWICGSAVGECWRQSLLLQSHKIIYITEGETDALTLLSLEIEKPSESLVLALASASMIPKPAPFQGREIVIVADPDMAGAQAEKRLREVLGSLARSFITVPLLEVING